MPVRSGVLPPHQGRRGEMAGACVCLQGLIQPALGGASRELGGSDHYTGRQALGLSERQWWRTHRSTDVLIPDRGKKPQRLLSLRSPRAELKGGSALGTAPKDGPSAPGLWLPASPGEDAPCQQESNRRARVYPKQRQKMNATRCRIHEKPLFSIRLSTLLTPGNSLSPKLD